MTNTNSEHPAVDNREEIERQKMTQLFTQMGINDYFLEPVGGKTRHDGTYTSKRNNKVIFETKVREISSTKFQTTIIEVDKFTYMIEEAKKQNKIPYLFVFFTDGLVFYQKLEESQFEFQQEGEAKRSTYGNNQNVVTKNYVNFKINKEQLIKLN